MRTRTKIWLIIAVSLVLIGFIVFASTMSTLEWDFAKLSTAKYENNDYEIHEAIQHISVITDTADIVFVPSEGSIVSVSCYEQEGNMHSVSVKDGTLEIKNIDTRKWYEYIGFNFDTPKITVYIPEGEYGKLSVKASTGDVKYYASALEDVKIKTTTGNICIEDASIGSLDLTVSTGKVTVSGVTCEGDIAVGVSTGKTYLSNIQCKNFTSSGSTGDISLNNVIATEKLSINRSTGDVKFDSSDAAEIYIETDTGDVTGSLLTDKVFITQTGTGKINVPKSVNGGRCEITTSTGDIKIDIQ